MEYISTLRWFGSACARTRLQMRTNSVCEPDSWCVFGISHDWYARCSSVALNEAIGGIDYAVTLIEDQEQSEICGLVC